MAQAGTADMGPVAPANRVDRVDRVDLAGMDPGDRADLAVLGRTWWTGRQPGGPGGHEPGGPGEGPRDRRDRDPAARDPGRNLVHPDRAAQTPAHRRRRLPDPDPTRAHPHLTQRASTGASPGT